MDLFRLLFGRKMEGEPGAAGGAPSGGDPAGGDPAGGDPAGGAVFDWKTTGINDAGMLTVNERQWKNPSDMLQSYANLEKLKGGPADKLFRIPDSAEPAAWRDIYGKMGMPATADKYEIKVPEGDDGSFANVAREWFHNIGLSQNQVSGLTEFWNKYIGDTTAGAATATTEKNAAELQLVKNEWAGEFDSKELVIKKAIDAFGMTDPQLEQLKAVMGVKDGMTFLYNIGSKVTLPGSDFVPGNDAPGFDGMTVDAAASEIKKLRADPDFAKEFVSADPKVKREAQEKMDRLHKIAFPDSTQFNRASNLK